MDRRKLLTLLDTYQIQHKNVFSSLLLRFWSIEALKSLGWQILLPCL
jgi:hypothetical protein